ncbi:hypothetical protein F5887DRAFT_915284 [Amanita rubescens]|nr:hypothetical protein F5887DRAFT_915284 [Amanita rubescens]
MSEYWVSKKKYFCKYCEIYIADDVPSRQHHENGLRHQGNRERFIRNIYKASEKKKKDLEEEKRELARVEQRRTRAPEHRLHLGIHIRTRPKSCDQAIKSIRLIILLPESLGYTDPDAERAEAEAERRRTQGVAGEWQSTEDEPTDSTTISSSIPTKREVDAHSDDDYDRHSKLRKKIVRTGLGEIYDPGIISIKLKKKEEPPPSTEELIARMGGDASSSAVKQEDEKPTGLQKWVKVQWNQIPEESIVSGKPFLNVTGAAITGRGCFSGARRAAGEG